ncbi:hypothetical protein HYPGJ_31532 [Hyphomicrobium sp. GJ21]|nr:hypothetical protein HYPGJ_31532 [Hyphomicrobium sp. GJ21]
MLQGDEERLISLIADREFHLV